VEEEKEDKKEVGGEKMLIDTCGKRVQ